MAAGGSKPRCDCCGNKRCNKTFRIPVEGGGRRIVVLVCGRCVVHNARRLRAWLDQKEESLRCTP